SPVPLLSGRLVTKRREPVGTRLELDRASHPGGRRRPPPAGGALGQEGLDALVRTIALALVVVVLRQRELARPPWPGRLRRQGRVDLVGHGATSLAPAPSLPHKRPRSATQLDVGAPSENVTSISGL